MDGFYKQLPIKAIFIDFDGTLADTMSLLYDIYIQFLKSKGHMGSKDDFRTYIGHTIPQLVADLKETFNLKESEELLLKEYQELLNKQYIDQIEFFPKAIETIEYVKEELEYPVALVTSAPRYLVQKILAKHQLEHLFDVIVGAEDISKGKPDPEIYLKALKLMKLTPDSILAFEDSLNGVESALAAGLNCILVLNGDEELAYHVRKEWELPERLSVMQNWDEIDGFFRTFPLFTESDFYDD